MSDRESYMYLDWLIVQKGVNLETYKELPTPERLALVDEYLMLRYKGEV